MHISNKYEDSFVDIPYITDLEDKMISIQWTIYSATTFLEKCRKVVLEK